MRQKLTMLTCGAVFATEVLGACGTPVDHSEPAFKLRTAEDPNYLLIDKGEMGNFIQDSVIAETLDDMPAAGGGSFKDVLLASEIPDNLYGCFPRDYLQQQLLPGSSHLTVELPKRSNHALHAVIRGGNFKADTGTADTATPEEASARFEKDKFDGIVQYGGKIIFFAIRASEAGVHAMSIACPGEVLAAPNTPHGA